MAYNCPNAGIIHKSLLSVIAIMFIVNVHVVFSEWELEKKYNKSYIREKNRSILSKFLPLGKLDQKFKVINNRKTFVYIPLFKYHLTCYCKTCETWCVQCLKYTHGINTFPQLMMMAFKVNKCILLNFSGIYS